MISPRASWHAEDSVSAAVRVGDRPVHAFWPVLRESFHWILLPPRRRASGDAISWEWMAERSPPAPGSADFAALRERLDAALANLSVQLNQRDDESGALMELRAVMESWVRGLMRSADAQLAAYAVATEAGWMIRSWGFPHPAKAVCAGGCDAGISQPAKSAAGGDARAGDRLSELRARRRRRRWLWWMAATAGMAVAGLIVRRQSGAVDTRSKSIVSSMHENALNSFTSGKEAVSDNLPMSKPGRAPVDGPRNADAPIKNPQRRSLQQAGSAALSSEIATFLAVSSSVGQSEAAFADLSLGSSGQIRDSTAERVIAVPGRDSGRDNLADGAVQPAGTADALGLGAGAPVASTVSGPSGDVLGHTPLKVASPTPLIAAPASRTGAAPAVASVSEPSKAGVAAPLDLTPTSSPEKSSPGSGADSPPGTVTPTRPIETPKLSLDSKPVTTDPSQAPAQTVTGEAQNLGAEPSVGHGSVARKAGTAKKSTGADPLADDPKEARTASLPDVSAESAEAPSDSSSVAPHTTASPGLGIADSITLREPLDTDTRRLTVRLGEWRLVRARDVVLATWPAEQAAAQALHMAREQAWAQIKASVPASFREARVRTGLSLRLSRSGLVPAAPVWCDATNGQPCADAEISGDSILLNCTDPRAEVDREMRLIAADGRELARLVVSLKGRRFDVTIKPEVREAAPWFALMLDPAEKPAERFQWKGLSPKLWPDQAWKGLRKDSDVGVVCYSPDMRRRLPITGALAVIDSASGWALSRAITLQDDAN